MATVRYVVEFQHEDRPTMLPGDTKAVPADACKEYDIGQGGVTREEIELDDVAALVTYPVGSELFIESSLASDCLDDTDDETARETRIWWRAIVTG